MWLQMTCKTTMNAAPALRYERVSWEAQAVAAVQVYVVVQGAVEAQAFAAARDAVEA